MPEKRRKTLWFVSLNFYKGNWKKLSKDGWELEAYSEFSRDGIPKTVKLRKKK